MKKLKDDQLATRIAHYMEMLPDILHELVPDISTFSDRYRLFRISCFSLQAIYLMKGICVENNFLKIIFHFNCFNCWHLVKHFDLHKL